MTLELVCEEQTTQPTCSTMTKTRSRQRTCTLVQCSQPVIDATMGGPQICSLPTKKSNVTLGLYLTCTAVIVQTQQLHYHY